MSLTAGTRLGVYEVTAQIGAGGMGEVYRARDSKLNRDVAIKVLPELFAAVPDRLSRFEREAQTLASLNHPNIAAIYGIVELPPEGGSHVNALVMELVEGEDLSAHIARGPMPLADALPIARQIADALEAAHDQGIVHRDLKPANIKVRTDGTVKVLDFGLAKAMDPGGGSAVNVANSPTLTKATHLGVILGTAAYMAPEQARGKAVDKRADIWAFGVVVYEMLTGRRAFDGDEMSDVLAAVLRQDIDWTALPAGTPIRLRRLLERCLDRDSRTRLRDIGEARVEIAKVESGTPDRGSGVVSTPAVLPARRRGSRSMVLIAGVLVLAAVAAASWWSGRRTAASEPAWSQYAQLTDASGVETGPSLSPDGGSFVYASNAKGSWDIYVQRVGGRNPVLVAGDPARDELWPAFSPDGKQLAFSQGGGTGGIFIVGATGESVRRVTEFGSNPAWSPDGQRLVFCSEEVKSAYNTFTLSTLWTVDVNGGAPAVLETRAQSVLQPAWSPSGGRIAFWVNHQGQRDLATIPAAGGQHVLITDDAAVDWAPVWSPDGRFLYFASDRGGSMGIWRIAVDEASGRATGVPEPIAAGVDVAMDLPHLSADGNALVFRSQIQSVNPAAIAFDPVTERAGAVTLLQRRTGMLMPIDVSPDGRWLALNNIFERQQDIFVMRPDGTGLSRLSDDLARDWSPRFTPDSSSLVFFSNRSGSYELWSIRLDGSNRTQLTDVPDGTVAYGMFAPDGRRVFVALMNRDVLLGSAPWPVTRKTATLVKAQKVDESELMPSVWSRDGRWLAGPLLPSSGSGMPAGLALYDITAGTVRRLNADAAGSDMAWMPDYKRVVYFTRTGKLVIQNIESLARHEIAVTLPLPPDDIMWSIAGSPDGRTIYYGAQQTEANIWKLERPGAARK